MLELLPVCLYRLTAGGGREEARGRENALWGRLRMPPVGVEAVGGTITNSSSGVKILAQLRLCVKREDKYRYRKNNHHYSFYFGCLQRTETSQD